MRTFEIKIPNSLESEISERPTIKEITILKLPLTKDDLPPPTEQDNYKVGVLDAHKVLDSLNISPVIRGETTCNDPDCDSPVGHRLRQLRDMYLTEKTLLEEVRRIVKQSTGLIPIELVNLLNGSRGH